MNSRRNFLRVAGVGFTGSLLNSVNSQASSIIHGKSPAKIGVLLPQSNEHPLYSASFLNGLRLALNQNNAIIKNAIEIITEQVNFGTPQIVKEKTQKLIAENNVHLITGILNPEVVSHLDEIVKNAQLPLFVANSGENFISKRLKENSHLFFNTLNLYQSAYLSGKHAVNKYGKKVAIVSSSFDSGYDAIGAFYLGVQSAGGEIVANFIENHNNTNFISDTLDNIENSETGSIYVLLNGNLADDFFRMKSQRKINQPVITTSFAAEDNRLVNLGEAAGNVQSFGPWTKNLNNTENTFFIQEYKKQYSKEPDQFGFLGYESGLIIYNSLSECKGDFSGNTIAEKMSACRIKTPGGDININKETGMVNKPVVLCQTVNSVFGNPENNVVQECTANNNFYEDFASIDTDIRSGWLNPYLFV